MTAPHAAPAFTHDSPGTPAARWRAHPAWASLPEPRPAPGTGHLLVVAAHPDDETLGAGALIRHAATAGWRIDVVVATLGEASHPGSPTHSPERLARIRAAEVTAAVAALAPSARLHLCHWPDGALARWEPELAEALLPLTAPDTLVVAPWTGDGHPDHEAAGRAAAAVAAASGATCWQYPIWFWHWGDPRTAPWPVLTRRRTCDAERAARRRAAEHHRSQVAPLSTAPGDEALLAPGLLEHFADDEVFVIEPGGPHPRAAFEPLHAADPDPWGTRSRWYEARRRDLLLAALTRPRYGRALEVGCSVGALTEALAQRCDRVTGMDAAPAALARAREHLEPLGDRVEWHLGTAPEDMPPGPFDLVVLSEVGYFLRPLELAATLARAQACLAPEGELVLCHWRHEVAGWPLDGDHVHEMAARRLGLARIARYADDDVLLEVYARPGTASVAAREGLT